MNMETPLNPQENKNDRFAGKGGEEYELLLMAYPHYAELQKTVGSKIAETFKNIDTPEIKVLEIGCGTGITTDVLLNADKRVKIVALDNEQVMLDQAKEKLGKYITEERVELVLSDALEHLEGTPSNSIEAVASVFVLHNFKKEFRAKVIEEIYRVLKPGGVFVNGDKYALDDESAHRTSYEKQIERFDAYDRIGRSDYKDHWVEHFKYDDAPDIIFKEGQALEQLKNIGFKDIQLVYREAMEATISAMK